MANYSCKELKKNLLSTLPPKSDTLAKFQLTFHLNITRLPFLKIYLFIIIIFWLCWVFVAVCRLSLVVVSGGYSSLQCAGFSLWWLLLLRSTGSRHAGSVAVPRGLSSCGSRVLECRLSSCGARA